MSLKVWMNGELVRAEDARIGVYDHGLLYGDGVFEGIRSYQGRMFRLDKHLERLYASAQNIRLAIPYTAEKLSVGTGKPRCISPLVEAAFTARTHEPPGLVDQPPQGPDR